MSKQKLANQTSEQIRAYLLKYRQSIAKYPGLWVLNNIINQRYDRSELLLIVDRYASWFKQNQPNV